MRKDFQTGRDSVRREQALSDFFRFPVGTVPSLVDSDNLIQDGSLPLSWDSRGRCIHVHTNTERENGGVLYYLSSQVDTKNWLSQKEKWSTKNRKA